MTLLTLFLYLDQVAAMNIDFLNLTAAVGFFNPSLNPFIYAARYDVFKRTLKQMFNRGSESSSGGWSHGTHEYA